MTSKKISEATTKIVDEYALDHFDEGHLESVIESVYKNGDFDSVTIEERITIWHDVSAVLKVKLGEERARYQVDVRDIERD